jgi:hypothetical protein
VRSETGEVRAYRLAGLVRCGLCGRWMDSHLTFDIDDLMITGL